MLITNMILIVLLSAVCIVKVYQAKDQLQNSTIHTHIVIMSISMFTALTLGTILGVMFMHDFVSAAIIATLFGLISGFAVGRPFHSIAAIGGMAEGGMGGLMGAMTGMMIHMAENLTFFLVFINLMFAMISFYLLWTLTTMAAGKTEKSFAVASKSINM